MPRECGGIGSYRFHIKWTIGTHANWKNQNSGGRFGATSWTALPIQPIYLKIGPNWPNWQCCLAGSYKTAPRILIFSIAMGADYSFYVKSIATYAPAFLGHNNSVLARVLKYGMTNLILVHWEVLLPSLIGFLRKYWWTLKFDYHISWCLEWLIWNSSEVKLQSFKI